MHAFGICWGLAIVGAPLAAALGAGSWRGAAALFGALLLYIRVFLPAKRRVLPGARRKLLIDFCLFVGPVYGALAWAVGLTTSQALAALCLAVPAGIVALRSGCFLAGCCHGRPSRWGPRYRETRVLPLPLIEATVAVGLLVAAAVALTGEVESGTLGLVMALSYVGYRFFAEFFRARSGAFRVRRFGGLSLAQWLCASLVVSSVIGGVL